MIKGKRNYGEVADTNRRCITTHNMHVVCLQMLPHMKITESSQCFQQCQKFSHHGSVRSNCCFKTAGVKQSLPWILQNPDLSSTWRIFSGWSNKKCDCCVRNYMWLFLVFSERLFGGIRIRVRKHLLKKTQWVTKIKGFFQNSKQNVDLRQGFFQIFCAGNIMPRHCHGLNAVINGHH